MDPGKAPAGIEVGPNLLLVDISTPGKSINPMSRCKKCYISHGNEDRPRFLPWGLSKYVLNKFSELAPPFHLTAEDVKEEVDSSELIPYVERGRYITIRIGRGWRSGLGNMRWNWNIWGRGSQILGRPARTGGRRGRCVWKESSSGCEESNRS